MVLREYLIKILSIFLQIDLAINVIDVTSTIL